MPQVPDIKTFEKRMNKEIDPRFLGAGEYIHAENILNNNHIDGKTGAITNLPGVANFNGNGAFYISYANSDKVIGLFRDNQSNAIYAFIYGQHVTGDYHRIVKYTLNPNDADYGIWKMVIYSTNLPWKAITQIKSCDIVDGMILWTDGDHEPGMWDQNVDHWDLLGVDAWEEGASYVITPTQSNVHLNGIRYRALQAHTSDSGNAPTGEIPNGNPYWQQVVGDFIPAEWLTLAREVPRDIPVVSVYTDTTFKSNNIKGKYFQFKYRYIYANNQRSVFSGISEVTYSENDYFAPTLSVGGIFQNAISVQISSDNVTPFIKKIEIAARSGNSGDFKSIAEIGAETLISIGSLSFNFYNNGFYDPIELQESNQIYSDIPRTAGTQRFINNRIVFGDCKTGYDKDIIPYTAIEYKFRDAFSGTSLFNGDTSALGGRVLNSPTTLQTFFDLIGYIPEVGDSISFTGKSSTSWVSYGRISITVNSGWGTEEIWDVIDAKIFTLLGYKEVIDTSGKPHASQTKMKIYEDKSIPTGGISGSIYYGNTYFEYTIKRNSRLHRPSFKDGAFYNIAYQYYDKYGRTNGTIHNEEDRIYIPTIGERDGINQGSLANAGAVDLSLNITHDAPTWATHYSILYSRATSMNYSLHTSVESALDFAGVTGDIATPLPVTAFRLNLEPLRKFLDKQEGSISGMSSLYEFVPGDRIRFITKGIAGAAAIDDWVDEVFDYEIVNAGTDWLGNTTALLADDHTPDNYQWIDVYATDILVADIEDAIIEIYRPGRELEVDESIFYESPYMYPASGGKHGGMVAQYDNGQDSIVTSAVEFGGAIFTFDMKLKDMNDGYPASSSKDGGTPQITITGGPAAFHGVYNIVSVISVDDDSVTLMTSPVSPFPTWPAGRTFINAECSYDNNDTALVILSGADAYNRVREMEIAGSDASIQVNSFHISDYSESAHASIGRPSAIINQEEAQRKATLMYTEIYIPNTDINNLNRLYTDVNFEEYNKTFGAIKVLYNEGDHLLMIQEDKASKIYVDKSIVYDGKGNNQVLATEKRVLSTAVPYTGTYGTRHSESFRAIGNRKYWLDAERGAVIRLSVNGIEEISKYGMKGWFSNECDALLRLTNSETYSLFDIKHESYIIAFNDSANVLAFNETNNAWTSFITRFNPKYSVYINNRVFYIDGRSIYEINVSSVNKNTIDNNTPVASSIKFVSNIDLAELKNYIALALDSSHALDVIIETEPIGGGTKQQSTLDSTIDFTQRESEWHASFLRDVNTPNVTYPILEGDNMKGKHALITLTLPVAVADEDFFLKLANIIVSKG